MKSSARGQCGRGGDLAIAGLGVSVADVLGDGAAEQEGLLGDVGEARAEALHPDVAQVVAVDQDPARGGVVEAGDEVDHGGLAGSRGSNERDGLAGFGGDGHVLEDRGDAVVAESRRCGTRRVRAAGPDRQPTAD